VAGGSWDLTERLLDDLDAVKGPVLGTVAAHPRVSWPFVAAQHADRDRAPERTVGKTSLPLILPDAIRDRHLAVFGKTGGGKTTCLRNLILQDIAAGHGVSVIAKEAELLTDEILPFLPPERLGDVIYVDAADARAVSLNPFHVGAGEDIDLKVDETLSALSRLFADEGPAPRMEMILGRCVATLMRVPDSTLSDVPRLLDRTDDAFRQSVIAQLADEELRHFWTSTYTSLAKDSPLPILNRLYRFLSPKVRNVLCRPGSLDIRAAMDQGKIVLISVSDGILGPRSAEVVAGLVMAKIQLATMSRANVPPAARRPFRLYLDEFPALIGSDARTYETMLVRARKFRVSLTLAAQRCGMIPEALLGTILANVASMIVFGTGSEDARRLGRELAVGGGGKLETQLLGLAVGEAYCKIDRKVTLARMLLPPRGGSAAIRAEAIRRSRETYGSPPVATPKRNGRPVAESLDPTEVF